MADPVVVKYDQGGGDIAANISVGQNLKASVQVNLYGPDNHLIKTIANVIVQPGDMPEYAIDKKDVSKLSKFGIEQRYHYVGAGPGDFESGTVFVQDGAMLPPIATSKANSTGHGIYSEIILFEARQ